MFVLSITMGQCARKLMCTKDGGFVIFRTGPILGLIFLKYGLRMTAQNFARIPPKLWRISGEAWDVSPSRPNFFHSHVVLGNNRRNNKLTFSPSLPGKSWIRHCTSKCIVVDGKSIVSGKPEKFYCATKFNASAVLLRNQIQRQCTMYKLLCLSQGNQWRQTNHFVQFTRVLILTPQIHEITVWGFVNDFLLISVSSHCPLEHLLLEFDCVYHQYQHSRFS